MLVASSPSPSRDLLTSTQIANHRTGLTRLIPEGTDSSSAWPPRTRSRFHSLPAPCFPWSRVETTTSNNRKDTNMQKFKVTATMYTDLFVIVEADNEVHAFEIAKELDGADFQEEPNSGDWTIGDVLPLFNQEGETS